MNSQTRQYKQLPLGQRYQIQALVGKDHLQKDIAASSGTSESTLSRELNRNMETNDYNDYCAETAHACAVNRRTSARKSSKFDEQQMTVIRQGLSLGWSLWLTAKAA